MLLVVWQRASHQYQLAMELAQINTLMLWTI